MKVKAGKMVSAKYSDVLVGEDSADIARKELHDSIKDFKCFLDSRVELFSAHKCISERTRYHINADKGVVVCIITLSYRYSVKVAFKGVARCSGGDVFNEAIGTELAYVKAAKKALRFQQGIKYEVFKVLCNKASDLDKLIMSDTEKLLDIEERYDAVLNKAGRHTEVSENA